MALNPVGDILKRADKALKNVDGVLGHVDGKLGAVDTTLVGVDEKLTGVDEALDDVKVALGEVRDLLAELELPSRAAPAGTGDRAEARLHLRRDLGDGHESLTTDADDRGGWMAA